MAQAWLQGTIRRGGVTTGRVQLHALAHVITIVSSPVIAVGLEVACAHHIIIPSNFSRGAPGPFHGKFAR
jgi:hypothetical protein